MGVPIIAAGKRIDDVGLLYALMTRYFIGGAPREALFMVLTDAGGVPPGAS